MGVNSYDLAKSNWFASSVKIPAPNALSFSVSCLLWSVNSVITAGMVWCPMLMWNEEPLAMSP